jgi:hypothetical protein
MAHLFTTVCELAHGVDKPVLYIDNNSQLVSALDKLTCYFVDSKERGKNSRRARQLEPLMLHRVNDANDSSDNFLNNF